MEKSVRERDLVIFLLRQHLILMVCRALRCERIPLRVGRVGIWAMGMDFRNLFLIERVGGCSAARAFVVLCISHILFSLPSLVLLGGGSTE